MKNRSKNKKKGNDRNALLQAGKDSDPDVTDRVLAQVSSKDLTPPEQPDETTEAEADIDFANEEAKLDAEIRALKERRAKLDKRKKQAIGGKKLERMRKYAAETTEWAKSAAAKYVVSIGRANDAVAKLAEYEDKLQIPVKRRLGEQLVGGLELLTEAAEVLNPTHT